MKKPSKRKAVVKKKSKYVTKTLKLDHDLYAAIEETMKKEKFATFSDFARYALAEKLTS